MHIHRAHWLKVAWTFNDGIEMNNFLKFLHLGFKDEPKSYEFEMTLGWVNDNRMLVFEWSNHLKVIIMCTVTHRMTSASFIKLSLITALVWLKPL